MASMISAESRLKPCPESPNCVASLEAGEGHGIAPLRLQSAYAAAWTGLRDVVMNWPRAEIVEEDDTYLKARVRSRMFRFVDDLEFELRADDGVVHVRSASRSGYWDLGVNRRRVESIRAILAGRGLVEP